MEELVFSIKKIVLRLMFPVSVTLILLAAGILLRKRASLSLVLVLCGLLVLATFSFPIVALSLIGSLESRAGDYAKPARMRAENTAYIVVLSGEFREGDLTAADSVGTSVIRLIEGVRLWKEVPDSKLVVTGGIIPGLSRSSIARSLAEVAHQVGVPQNAIILEEESWTTEDQARMTADIVKDARFALVTSAYHMPRSLLLFRAAGLDPVPAPCDFTAKKYYLHYDTLIPQAQFLLLSQIAIKEYIGLAFYGLRERYFRPEPEVGALREPPVR